MAVAGGLGCSLWQRMGLPHLLLPCVGVAAALR
jgi:hypothetical protein